MTITLVCLCRTQQILGEWQATLIRGLFGFVLLLADVVMQFTTQQAKSGEDIYWLNATGAPRRELMI